MSSLEEIQNWMAELLRHRHALPKDAAIAEQARRYLTGNDRLAPVEQLEIYREQFWLRHTGSLLEDFPGVSGIVGQASWERLAEGYLTAHPPTSWTLRDLGKDFPGYIENEATWLEHHALCVDMARLEWAYIELFDAAPAPLLDPAKVASVPTDAWEHVHLVLSPALRLLAVSYPVAELRGALRSGEENVAIPEARSQNLVLYRGANLRLFHKPVSDPAFALLSALGRGEALGAAAELAAEQCPRDAGTIAAQVTEWFTDWGRRGWIVDLEIP